MTQTCGALAFKGNLYVPSSSAKLQFSTKEMWFIAKGMDDVTKNEVDYEEKQNKLKKVVNFAKVWSSQENHKCTYGSTIDEQVKTNAEEYLFTKSIAVKI